MDGEITLATAADFDEVRALLREGLLPWGDLVVGADAPPRETWILRRDGVLEGWVTPFFAGRDDVAHLGPTDFFATTTSGAALLIERIAQLTGARSADHWALLASAAPAEGAVDRRRIRGRGRLSLTARTLDLVVRVLGRGDDAYFEDVVTLHNAIDPFSSATTTLDHLNDWLEDGLVVHGAFVDATLVGTVGVRPSSNLWCAPVNTVECSGLSVRAEWRRRGVATALLAHVVTTTTPDVVLEASWSPSSTDASSFWLRTGLTPLLERRVFPLSR